MASPGFRWSVEKFNGQSEGIGGPLQERSNIFLQSRHGASVSLRYRDDAP